MTKRSGFYPRVRFDATGSGLVSHVGSEMLTEMMRRSAWTGSCSRRGPWRRPIAVHDPARFTDLAVSLAVDGDCMADIAALRGAPGGSARWRRTRPRGAAPISWTPGFGVRPRW